MWYILKYQNKTLKNHCSKNVHKSYLPCYKKEIQCTALNYVSKSKLAPVVEGDQKAPFSVATTPRCRRGALFLPWIVSLYPWYISIIAETRRHQVPFLKSLVWHDLGLNPGLPDHWQTLYPLGVTAIYCFGHILAERITNGILFEYKTIETYELFFAGYFPLFIRLSECHGKYFPFMAMETTCRCPSPLQVTCNRLYWVTWYQQPRKKLTNHLSY